MQYRRRKHVWSATKLPGTFHLINLKLTKPTVLKEELQDQIKISHTKENFKIPDVLGNDGKRNTFYSIGK